ncbi:MAG TPA: NUDIX domain-containing protein [Candidatus Limnocylindrales bacterium]|nr:NUDIX domain-containing protein [Candidatus Limnocylindrales bacterium]
MSEELYDVLDEKGNKTSQALPKSVVHDQELWHGSAFVWIYNAKGELLLQFRAVNKKLYANVWDVSVGGHISAGDDPIATAVREAAEELGVKIKAQELTQLGYCKDEDIMINGKRHREHDWIFLLSAELAKEQLILQESEVTNAKWLPVNQLEADLCEPGWKTRYAGRNKYIYETAIKEVRKRLNSELNQ